MITNLILEIFLLDAYTCSIIKLIADKLANLCVCCVTTCVTKNAMRYEIMNHA